MSRITEQQLKELRNLPIESVAQRLGLHITRHKTLCFMHDDHHPSLMFNTSRNTWKCFVCGKGGDAISLVMERNGQSFTEACQWLGTQFGIFNGNSSVPVRRTKIAPTFNETPFVAADEDILKAIVDHSQLTGKAKKFLFEERKYTPEAINALGICALDDEDELLQYLLSKFPMQRLKAAQIVFDNYRNPNKPKFYFHAPCLFFPYYNEDGKLVNLQARYLGRKKAMPRFQFLKGVATGVYNIQTIKTLDKNEPLFVAEGVTDAIALTSCGYKAIAIPSATTAKKEDLEKLASHPLLMYPDNDAPGEGLFNEVKNAVTPLGGCITRLVLPKDYKDFSELYLSQFDQKE